MGNPLGPPGPGPAPGVTTVAGLSDVTGILNFTPTVSFGTPGDLAVTYGAQVGRYTKIGIVTFFYLQVTTTAFTFTTASGTFLINTGALVVQPGGRTLAFPAAVGGVTFAGNSYVQGWPQAASSVTLIVSTSGTSVALAANTNFVSGTNLNITMQGIVF